MNVTKAIAEAIKSFAVFTFLVKLLYFYDLQDVLKVSIKLHEKLLLKSFEVNIFI